jgi:hypothetical protein
LGGKGIQKTPLWGVGKELGEEFTDLLSTASKGYLLPFLIAAKPDKEVGQELGEGGDYIGMRGPEERYL